MADLKLPPNTTIDSNTGLYVITNSKGQTVRVGAQTQAELDQYANSVRTGTPVSVATTNPITGDPQTSNFDPTAIIQQKQDINSQAALLTATKRQTGLLGNTDGSYYDIRTGQTFTQQEAAAKIQAAGLPPEALVAITPKNAPTYAAAQAAVNNTTNVPSNRTGDNAEQPSQAPAATGTSIPPANTTPAPTVESSAPAAAAPVPAPATETPAQPTTSAQTPLPGNDPQLADPTADIAPPATTAAPTSPPSELADPTTNAIPPETFNPELADPTADIGFPPTTIDELPELSTPPGVEESPYVGAVDTETGLTLAPEPIPSELANRTGEAASLPTTAADIKAAEMGAAMRAAIAEAQNQSTYQQRYGQSTNSGDWRVRIRLGKGANYLYAEPEITNDNILWPLSVSDGVIFPYVPQIQTAYMAQYDAKPLTHSNYRGLFYRSSYVNDIQITGTFTAQDTVEAQYLLAVIHFFRSVTKMFYGQDQKRGTPPPVVYLSGYGQFQFNNHPCVVSNFNYTLPNQVDYIRIDPSNQGQNLVTSQNLVSSSPTNISTALARIQSLKNLITGTSVRPGAQGSGNQAQDLGAVSNTVSGIGQTTYVPTRMEIVVTLHPVQTRTQISQQFSLTEFANGSQLKGGFW